MSRSRSAVAAVVLAAVLLCGAALAQSSLEYRNRGNRFEGVRALPVSGYTIELLSAQAIYREPVPAGAYTFGSIECGSFSKSRRRLTWSSAK